jgi:hypothetical protein
MVYQQLHFSSATAFDPKRPSWPLQGGASFARFRIESISFPMTFHNVDESCNSVVFTEGSDSYTARIKVGSHNADSGPIALQNALNEASPTKAYAVTFLPITRNLEIRNASVPDFSIQTATGGSTAYLMVGIPRFGLPLRPTGGVITTSMCQFASTVPLLLASSSLYTSASKFSGRDDLCILAQIPPGDNGAMIFYEPNGGWLTFGREISELDISLLRGSNLQPVDLQGGIVSLTIGILTDEDDVIGA